jgi:ElaB/YqjD/DUF883 family membrane-anchored ribosome-binding protein
METTANEFNHEPRLNIGKTIKKAARDAVGEVRELREARIVADQEVRNLIADIQELIARMKDAADPELSLLRAKVEASISAVKQTIFDRAGQVQRRTQQALEAGDNYVRQRPWEAIGVASAAGLAIGFMLGRR